jgi:hypothetical protein
LAHRLCAAAIFLRTAADIVRTFILAHLAR